ncbi:MAG: MFS transporter [Sulfobacillus benefaciens]|uniref:MFS transporter n=1 Tax=Sulfobacillus benefaciens TaxID=453960 RepID=A0A2T2XD84_9FIRM|nr:MAG: MFS transporter [Sulfobacillus benefaciens]
MKDSVPSRQSSWSEAAIWAVAHAVNDGYPTLYLALLPTLMIRWHFAESQAGLLAGLLAVTTQALQPIMGMWADSRGGPWFIVGGLLIGSVGNALGLAWAPSYTIFAAVLMLGGLGNAAFHPHMAALVSQSVLGHKGRRMSGWMVSGMIGHILAPLAVVAAWQWGGKAGVASLALPGIVAAGLLFSSARSIPTLPRRQRHKIRVEWGSVWQRGRAFFVLVALRNLGTASLLTLLPIVWHQRGGAFSQTGALLAVVYSLGMIGNVLGGSASDRFGPRPILIGSLLGASLAAVGGALGTGTGWSFWLTVAVWGFAVNGAGAVLLVYGQSLFPGRLGMASGLTMGVGNTVGAFGAWAVGIVAETQGTTVAILVAAGCLAIAVWPTLWVGASRSVESAGSGNT